MELEIYKKSDFYEDYISSQKEYYERENADAYFAERLAEKDKEITELKQKLAEKESWVKMLGKGEAALSLELEKTKQKLESVQASMYADVVDANMENRRLRRALWLARSNRADGEFIYWCARLAMESGFTKSDICGYSVNTKRKLRTIGEWIEVWKNVKSKFLKKAEEYR